MAFSDREILARIIECEAGGEGDTGMQAVACVVMNRVQVTYGEYGRLMTLREVVYQPKQFTCAMETVGGQYNMQNIYNMTSRTGPSLETGLLTWALPFGISTPLGPPAGRTFPRRWGSS